MHPASFIEKIEYLSYYYDIFDSSVLQDFFPVINPQIFQYGCHPQKNGVPEQTQALQSVQLSHSIFLNQIKESHYPLVQNWYLICAYKQPKASENTEIHHFPTDR